MSDEDRSDIEQPTQLKQLNLNELSKLLWIKLTRKDVDALTKDVVDNLDSKNYKTTVSGHEYDLENAKSFLLEITISSVYRVYLHYSDKPSESEESIAENKIKKTKSWWNC